MFGADLVAYRPKFSALGRKILDDEIRPFRAEATSGDYDRLLQVCMAWVDVE